MNEAIKVLDHGFVRLVDHTGGDISIARAAKVSYDAAWRAGVDKGSDDKLIHYLWDNQHTTPFEAVTFTFEVQAPIFIFRQWHRHRTATVNELSARYRELPELFYVPDPATIGEQSSSSKQARVMTEELDNAAAFLIRKSCEEAFDVYRKLLLMKVPREIARSVLPLATYSHMFWTVNLLNLLKFLGLRSHPHAQWEMQQYARAVFDVAQEVAPVAFAAWQASIHTGGEEY